MPNVGRPSRDCHKCRQRRIKCDLIRPECHQCRRKGLPCPGYRNEQNIRIRIESVTTLPSNLRRDGRKSIQKEVTPPLDVSYRALDLPRRCFEFVHTSIAPPSTSYASSEQYYYFVRADGFWRLNKRLPIYSPLQEPWSSYVIPLVLRKFSFDADLGNKSVFTTIPRIISETEEGSVLYKACSAVGWAYMEKTAYCVNAVSNKTKAYGTALTAVNAALLDPVLCKADDTLLSVWMLGFYELISDTRHTIRHSGWDVHCRGMLELLRQKGPRDFRGLHGRNMFWMILSTVHYQAISTGRECPEETLPWIRNIYRERNTLEHMIVRAVIFSYHCTNICHRIQELIERNDSHKLLSNYPSILHDIDNVEKVTHPLSEQAPIRNIVIESPLEPYNIPDCLDLCYIGIGIYLSYFRMRLSHAFMELLRCGAKATECAPQQKVLLDQLTQRCIQEFRALTNKILTIIAILLGTTGPMALSGQQKKPVDDRNSFHRVGWPDAIQLLWPLRLIATSPVSLDWQRDSAKNILHTMDTLLGIM